MDIVQLQAFERIVREGSFSRAAWALDITQPTISARIQALEQEVGGALFVRGGRRIALTALGESFLPYARRALEVLAEGVEAARLSEFGQRGRVTVGTLQSLAGGFLAPAVARFHTSHPQVALYVRTGHSDQIKDMIHDGTVKIGLVTWPFFSTDLSPILLFREPLALIAHAQHPLAGRGTVTLSEVSQTADPFLIVPWGPALTPVFAQMETQHESAVEVPIDTVRHLLLRGIGASFLTRTLVADELASGRLVEIPVSDTPPLFRDSAVVRLARTPDLPAAVQHFVEVLREEAGELVLKG